MARVQSLKDVLAATETARKKGKKIVATNGCYDILHIGHVKNLEKAKSLGDVLVVGVNSDASVKANKGDLRPIIPAKERAAVIAALKSVDHVFIFNSKTTDEWIQKLRPHIHVKGIDTQKHPDFPAQKRALEAAGGKFALLPLVKGRSTTMIIETIASRYGKKPRKT